MVLPTCFDLIFCGSSAVFDPNWIICSSLESFEVMDRLSSMNEKMGLALRLAEEAREASRRPAPPPFRAIALRTWCSLR